MRNIKLFSCRHNPLVTAPDRSLTLFPSVAPFSLLLAIAIILAAAYGGTAQEKSSCITCHSGLEKRLSDPVSQFESDIHRSKGLSCHDCHGGNPAAADKAGAKDSMWGYTAKPEPRQLPAFCGKCHSDADMMKKFNPSLRVDQVQEYFTSVHGRRLQAGDQKVATCVSCHGVHGIRAPGDPQSKVYALNVAETCATCHASGEHMSGYGIAHDQYSKYKSSVHAAALYERKDLSAPTCNDCHGNHGAVPPGLTSVANVCGQCHNRQAQLFQNSPHKAPFERMQSGECLRCHSNHDILTPTDEMAGVGQGSVCISCHRTGDAGFTAAERMGKGLGDLRTGIENSEAILARAERAGMEVSRAKFELRDAVDGLTQARVLVHTSSFEEMQKALDPAVGVAAKSYAAGESAFEELGYRRKGLALSLAFILFLALLVYLKVRQIEGRYPFDGAANVGG